MVAPITALSQLELKSAIIRELLVVSPNTTVMAAVVQMNDARSQLSCILVVEKGELVGILTKQDVVRLFTQKQSLDQLMIGQVIGQVMVHPVVTLCESAFTNVFFAINLFQQNHIGHLPILDEQKRLVGLITFKSLQKVIDSKILLLENRNLELEEQIESRIATLSAAKFKQQQLIANIAMQIGASLNLQVILDTTVNQVQQILSCDRINILHFEAHWQAIVLAESTESSISFLGKRIDHTFSQEDIFDFRNRRIRIVRDIYTTEMPDSQRKMLTDFQGRAQILLPLLCDDQLWGLLNITEKHTRKWQQEEIDLLHTLSLQLAIALQQATMHQQLQEELSERKQAEESLRKSEARWQFALEGAGDGVWDWNSQTHKVFFSRQWKTMLGYPEDEVGDTLEEWDNRIHPDDRIQVYTNLNQHFSGKTPVYQSEHRIICKDGTYKWILDRGKVIEWIAKGRPLRVIGTHTDITIRKKAEAQLQNLIAGTIATTGQEFFPALVSHIAEAFNIPYVLVTEKVDNTLRTLAFWSDGSFKSTYVYDLVSTPCKQVLQVGEFYCEHSVQDMFLGNFDLLNLGVESYLGIALYNNQNEAIGHLCILDTKPIQDLQRTKTLLRVFAARAGAELERQQATLSLQKLNQELETEIETRTKDLKLTQIAVDLAAVGVFLVRSDNSFAYVNEKACDMLGYTQKELLNLSVIEIAVDISSYELWLEHWQKMKGHQRLTIESRHQTKDGHIYPVEVSINYLKLDGKEYLFACVRDITYRKKAELERQRLINELSDFKFALDQSAIVAITDANGIITYVNDRFCRISGYSQDEIIGKTHKTTVNSGYHPPGFFRDLWQTIKSGEIWRGEICNRTKDGNLYWIESTIIPFLDQQGQPFQYLAIRFDITDRKKAEQTICQQINREKLLREVTNRIRQSLDLQTIFDTACEEICQFMQADRVAIFKFDLDSKFKTGEFVAESVVTDFPSVLKIKVRDQTFGDNYAHLYTKGRFAAIADIYNNTLKNCHVNILARFQVKANLVMPLFDDQILWGLLCIHECKTTRQWQQDEIELTQQIANQLTIAIKQANLFEQLQQQLTQRQKTQELLTQHNQQLAVFNEELARATRLKDEFLANMSHELRTPLNAILGMTEGLQEGVFGNVNPQQTKALQTIEGSGSHLLELINDILDIAKIESGQLELTLEATNVSILCQSSLAFIKQQALKKSIELEIKQPFEVPDVLIDERRMRQVLINLLNNAVKFTPNGGHITLKITYEHLNLNITNPPSQSFLEISVIDTGIGIAPENMEKLFQPFIQIDSALNRQYQGTGLGLSLVKRIVELHGGQVEVTSEVGVGSCFTIYLPCQDSVSSSCKAETPSHILVEPNQLEDKSSPLILLVEDNQANISTVSSYLRAKGYGIILAKNGHEAIALAESANPDLILMDIQMPEMDGMEAIQRIRSIPNLVDLPIIALTSLAMEGDKERCLAAGATDYISKPVKLKQLVSTIKQLLHSY